MNFGTDGLRGRFGTAPIDSDTITKLSQAIAGDLPIGARVVVGMDTRDSCEQILEWILCCFEGHELIQLGQVPTPVVAFETCARQAQVGIMITASHNSAHDNGLKFFGSNGLKMPTGKTAAWAKQVNAAVAAPPLRKRETLRHEPEHYRRFVLDNFGAIGGDGPRCGFDFANGAGSHFWRALIVEMGINAQFTGDQPDGANINLDCGSTHPHAVGGLIAREGLDIGFAFDGDGDRIVVVDGKGQVQGDHLLFVMARIIREKGQEVSALVGTVMCNFGLESALQNEGIKLIRTAVGDQNVLETLLDQNLPIGGEPSGHIIQAKLFPAGDGLLAALSIIGALNRQPLLFDQARAAVRLLPYFDATHPVHPDRRTENLRDVPEIAAIIRDIEHELAGIGRLIIRFSGTEPIVRVHLEAPDPKRFKAKLDDLAKEILERLT